VARYDSAYDALAGRAESLTTSIIFRLKPNMRLTLEDVSGFGRGDLSAALLLAY